MPHAQLRAEARPGQRTHENGDLFTARGRARAVLPFREESGLLLPIDEVAPLAEASFLLEELLADHLAAGTTALPVRDQGGRKAHRHATQRRLAA